MAGSDFNGPRIGVDDPFQPLSMHFDMVPNGSFVPVLTGSVVFTATGITLPTTLAGFNSGGYTSYAPAAQSVTPPAGWPNPAPGANATVGSQSPFRGNAGTCTITNIAGTTFPANQDIFVTKSVTAPVAGILDITIQIDNDVRIWVDGVEKTHLVPASANGSYDNISGFWKHENCADLAPALYSFSVTAGTHTISLWARDRGVVGFLDMQVVLR